jgi:RNA polymerase sigma factor (sigma-70 family)
VTAVNFLSPLKKTWVLTPNAFEKLLLSLDSDRERAAEKYEIIRQKLITFFSCNRCHSPEEYSDITVNRVARRLDEGKEIYEGKIQNYFLGVAGNVLYEYWSEASKRPESMSDLPTEKEILETALEDGERELKRIDHDRQIDCLEECMQKLSPQKRDLIIRYYEGETSIKIKNRKVLAEEMRISISSLRTRALRIREKLEDCLSDCMEPLPGK